MIRDGADAIAGTSVRDFYGGVDKHFRGTDDIIIMPLQSGTQWDAFGHVVFEATYYNGYGAEWVSSKGALKGDVANASQSMVGRGVLLDLPRALGVDWLEPGHAIGTDDLERAEKHARVTVGPGDFVFLRTGAMASARAAGSWATTPGETHPGSVSTAWVGWPDATSPPSQVTLWAAKSGPTRHPMSPSRCT